MDAYANSLDFYTFIRRLNGRVEIVWKGVQAVAIPYPYESGPNKAMHPLSEAEWRNSRNDRKRN